jgi:hypothetical protein
MRKIPNWLHHALNTIGAALAAYCVWVRRGDGLTLPVIALILVLSLLVARLSYLVWPHPRSRGKIIITEVIRPATKLKVKRPWE